MTLPRRVIRRGPEDTDVIQTRDLLLEIGTEEIPARMLDNGVADLARLLVEVLTAAGLAPAGVETFATPRRLCVRLAGLATAQADRDEVQTGPLVSVAFGPDGTPTKVGEGFARARGVDPMTLERVAGPKGEMVAVRKAVKGRPTAEVLAESMPVILGRLTFPKSMRWASGTGPFVRPIHWIVCLFGADVIPFTFADIESGSVTYGHRFLFPEPVVLSDPSVYEATLRTRGVEPVPAVRKAAIVAAMAAAEVQHGCRFLPNDALLNEVSNLVEMPNFLIAHFDADFLRLPREVLVTAMGSHQRFFAMEDHQGRLMRSFGVVCNTKARDMSVVARGNERVIAARLYDARFFYEQDRKHGLPSLKDRLPERLFLKGVGDMAAKSGWVKDLALALCDAAGVGPDVRATVAESADYAKADLMSAMVGEFPELQGIMGAYYARPEGQAETPVATAIREHYLPRFSGDAIPSTAAGAILAVSDRLDSIFRCFKAGAIPTGSKDPLALRRAAIGLLRICMGRPELQGIAFGRLLALIQDDKFADVAPAMQSFFEDRFRGILAEDFAVPTDFANAIAPLLATGAPGDLAVRARALADFASGTTDFRDFLDNVFKRVGNLLKQADEKVPGWRAQAEAAGLLTTDADHSAALAHDLEKAVEATRHAALGAYHLARESGAYTELIAAMYSFKDPLARFFGTGRDGVPVLIEADEGLRLARLALLHRVQALFDWFAEFGRISTR
jgi:glycyl-tRNA synthetase beta chain